MQEKDKTLYLVIYNKNSIIHYSTINIKNHVEKKNQLFYYEVTINTQDLLPERIHLDLNSLTIGAVFLPLLYVDIHNNVTNSICYTILDQYWNVTNNPI